jgi:PIN domain nuclease of toxin-antitoxin system
VGGHPCRHEHFRAAHRIARRVLAGRLSWEHKDPFDRVIVAQALRRNLTIATRDTKIIGAAMTPTLTA